MFGFVAKITKGKIFTLLGLIVVPVLIFSAVHFANNSTSQKIILNAKTSKQRIEFLSQFGWQCDEKSETKKNTIIPAEFDNIYEAYNKIQLNQGFDLTLFQGKTVKLYSYKIDNYPKDSEYVFATVLVSDGMVIGGDVHSTELNGFMHGFKRPT